MDSPIPSLIFHPGYGTGTTASAASPVPASRKAPKRPRRPPVRSSAAAEDSLTALFLTNWLILPERLQPLFFSSSVLVSKATTYHDMTDYFEKELRGADYFKEHYTTILTTLKANCRLRRAAHHLLRRWLLTRRFQAVNTEDLVTGDVPVRPVRLIDWEQRRTYTFEASTLLRDMRERLLQQSYLFPSPCHPRNPYTNLPLTFGQFKHVMEQFRQHGMRIHWTIAALEDLQYSLPIFKSRHMTALKMEAVDTLFSRPKEFETIDLVYDFIRDEYEHHDFPFCPKMFSWSVSYLQAHPIIREWRDLCRRYNMIQILNSDEVERERLYSLHITPQTYRLCEKNFVIRKAWLESIIKVDRSTQHVVV